MSLLIVGFANINKNVNAKQNTKFYLTGNYGTWSITEAKWKATISDLDYVGEISLEDDNGWEAGIGYDFGKLRTEFTYSESNNEINNVSARINEGEFKGTTVEASASGDFKLTNVFINNYLDFPIGREKKLIPYIGIGIGESKLSIPNIKVTGEEIESTNTWLFGYQGKLGISYLISKKLNIFGEGNYLGFDDLGVAGEKYGLESNSELNYRAGFRLSF